VWLYNFLIDGRDSHFSEAPASVIANCELVLSWINDLIVVEQALSRTDDKLRQLILKACSKVLLEVSNHCKDILLDAELSDLQEFSQDQDEVAVHHDRLCPVVERCQD
jgi:hypothetical protein